MKVKLIKILRQSYVLIVVLLVTSVGLALSLKNIEFEEKISSILPVGDKDRFLVEILDSATYFDKVIIHIHSPEDQSANPDLLTNIASRLSDSIKTKFLGTYLNSVEGQIQKNYQEILFGNFFQNLPLYLEDKDYIYFDSLLSSGSFDKVVQEHLKILNSPAGFVASKYLFRDPFGIVTPQLKRLSSLQVDNNLTIYNNYLVSKDLKHAVFFIVPKKNLKVQEQKKFIDELDSLIHTLESGKNKNVKIEYLGSLPIALANSKQVKKDVKLTVTLAVLCIVFLILYFFRRINNLWLIFLPALIGAVSALAVFAVFFKSVSAISLGIGSVLLGISVDYSLHFLTHLKHNSSLRNVVKDMIVPILSSSLTTATAFLCLIFIPSPAVQQLGMFAAISVVVASLASLIIVPLILKTTKINAFSPKNTLIERIAGYTTNRSGLFLAIISIVTILLGFFTPPVHFEKDISSVNFMTEKLLKAEDNLKQADILNDKKSYLLCSGNTLSEALINVKSSNTILDSLIHNHTINQYNSIGSIVFPQEIQDVRVSRWNNFWTEEKMELYQDLIGKAARNNGIKVNAYCQFTNLVLKKFDNIPTDSLFAEFDPLIKNFRISINKENYIVSVLHLPDSSRKIVQEVFQSVNGCHFVDQKLFFIGIFEKLKDDFNTLINLSLILVFFIVLLFLGRIELAIITFVPILISWIWTLGFISLLDIKLNFFNIVICSLVFGLGIDYSIFVTKGLVTKHKTGEYVLSYYKSSILISAITTIVGLGALLFAQHPALKSIAGLAIIGILSAVLTSFTIQPILFRSLTKESNSKSSNGPVTFRNIVITLITFGVFGTSSLLLTLLIPFIFILPTNISKKRYISRMVTHLCCKLLLFIAYPLKLKKINFDKFDLNKSSVIISNHQSMLDIIIYLAISPKIIILTKDWVWNNLFFGFVVRFSGHINISKGNDQTIKTVQQRVAEGCSVLVFPEGSRTKDGSIKRYHKGGFYIAQTLNLPISIITLFGANEVLPRGSFFLRFNEIIMKFHSTYTFKAQAPLAYSEVGKETCMLMREEYNNIRENYLPTAYYSEKVKNSFLYKGPILEHYVNIKLRIEQNYDVLNEIIPRSGDIIDVGCGYGYMALILKLSSPDRNISGIDYDQEKIRTAKNNNLNKHLKINYEHANAVDFNYKKADVFIISDVLHYLTPENQKVVLRKCAENLNSAGKIILRDGDSSLTKRHKGTKISEFFSTNIGFNKTSSQLNFFSREFIEQEAKYNNLDLKIIDTTKNTSNLIYILSKINIDD